MRKKRQILHANIIITGFSVNNTTLYVSRALDHTAINYLEWIAFDEFRECRRTLPAVDVYLCLLYSGVSSFFFIISRHTNASFLPTRCQNCNMQQYIFKCQKTQRLSNTYITELLLKRYRHEKCTQKISVTCRV